MGSMRANGRFDNICEILHISVTNLQMKKLVETADNGFWWCNWILTLPAPYDDQERDVVLPQWMSDRSVKEAVKAIVETRKLIRLARETGREFEPKEELPPLELAQNIMSKSEASKNAMRITNNFYNIVKIKETGEKDETSDDKNDDSDEELRKHREEQEEQEHQKKKNDEEYQTKIKQYAEHQNKLKDEHHQTKMKRYEDHLNRLTNEEHQKKMKQYEEHQKRL